MQKAAAVPRHFDTGESDIIGVEVGRWSTVSWYGDKQATPVARVAAAAIGAYINIVAFIRN